MILRPMGSFWIGNERGTLVQWVSRGCQKVGKRVLFEPFFSFHFWSPPGLAEMAPFAQPHEANFLVILTPKAHFRAFWNVPGQFF
jgi:hypothetical protein